MFRAMMAASRRGLAVASARGPCPQHSSTAGGVHLVEGSVSSRSPPARWFCRSAFPPPGAIRAPVDQLTYTNRSDMNNDHWMSGSTFMKEAEVFKMLNKNPLLKDVSSDMVALGDLRTFVVSTLGIAYENHKFGISVAISFFEENIEVSGKYKEVRLKEAWGQMLNPGRGITIGTAYFHLAVKIDQMVRKAHPLVKYPQCFDELLKMMKTKVMTESLEMLLLHHISVMSTADYIRFVGDSEILIKKKLPVYIRDPKVQKLLQRLFSRLSNLIGYDGNHWLTSLGKHKFLLVCYAYSEHARESMNPIVDPTERLKDSIRRRIHASISTGGFAAAVKRRLLIASSFEHRRMALNQISVQRDIVYHLYDEVLQAMKDCFPYSREDAAEASRAILPLSAVIIQYELFMAGWFSTEMKLTTYRSVSPYSLRCGVSLSTDHVLIFRRPGPKQVDVNEDPH